MVYNIIFMIFCWLIVFIFCMIFIKLFKDYIKYDKRDKFELIFLFLDIFFIVLIFLLPVFKFILYYN